MIQVIAIDDEPYSLQVLKEHCSKINFLQLQKTFTNPLEGLAYLNDKAITALFLDVKMHDISGVELAELLPSGTCIIFTTAYPDYAVKGFEVDAIDYLLKPITFSRFLKACHRLKNHFDTSKAEQVILVKNGTQIERVKTSEIYYIEATGNYLKLYTSKGMLLHRQTVKELIDTLPGVHFIRTHKSYVVNMEHISRIETHQLTIDNQQIPLSPNYRAEVWDRLGINR